MEELPKLLLEYPDKALLVFLVGILVWLMRVWRQERVERNTIQEARITDLKSVVEANTKAQLEVAAAGRAQAENYERLRQEVANRSRTRP
jgi:hypothetical protein